MHPDDSPTSRTRETAGHASEAERLYRRRLREVLGINAPGAEVILRLRRQMAELQARVRQLEAELAVRDAGQNARLMQYREICFEASWQEVVDPEEWP
jgi:hypothetical protein